MLTQLRLEQERNEKMQHKQEYLKRLREEEVAKKTARNNLINQLATSDKNAQEIIQSSKVATEAARQGMDRGAGAQAEGIASRYEALRGGIHGLYDGDNEMDVETTLVEANREFYDPLHSPYKDISDVQVRPQYQDPQVSPAAHDSSFAREN
ncbi:hypothetical protein EV182_008406, partial [Spiromyces aspiralis]